jgi:hypothetical protein
VVLLMSYQVLADVRGGVDRASLVDPVQREDRRVSLDI